MRQQIAGVSLLCAAGVAAACVWAVRTPATQPIDAPAPAPGSTPETSRPGAAADIRLENFQVALWTEVARAGPARPETVETPPPAPPPVRLQLIGIVRETAGPGVRDSSTPTSTLRAALYDPDSDRLLIVGDGERIGARTIKVVEAASVVIAEASGMTTRINLRQDLGTGR